MSEQPAAKPPSSKRGACLVAVLAVIFVVLLALIAKFATRDQPPPPPPPEELAVIPATLRIRVQPSAQAAVVAVATRGQRVQLMEDSGAWVRVVTANGIKGWAERSALERADELERRIQRTEAIRRMPPLEGVAVETATLFAGPGIFYPPVGELRKGARVQVYTRDHDFFAIEAGDGVAYAEIDTVDVAAAGGAEFEVAAKPPLPEETPEPGSEEPEGEPAEGPMVAPERELGRRGVYAVVPAGGRPPRVIDQVAPRYPAGARRAGVEGRVILRAVIRRDGSVGSVEVLRDLPYGLSEAARQAVRQWRFRPAEYQGEPIAVYYTVTVNFKLRD
jgi:TonB family protein